MDDITNQLNQILSDPNSMAQIQGIMSGLGLGGTAPIENSAPQTSSPPPSLGNDAELIGMVTKLAPLLGQIKQEDSSSNLLNALRPMLSQERRVKIDQAIRILQLMKLFPLLKDSGMLSSILGGLF